MPKSRRDENWTTRPFAEVVYFQEGPGIRNWQYRDTGIPFVNIRCLKDGRLDIGAMTHLDPDEVRRKYPHFLLDPFDYVVSSSGTLGRLAEVRPEDLPCMLNTSVIRMRPLNDEVDRRYLRYFIESPLYQDQIAALATGSAQLNYGPSHLQQMTITYPDQITQQAIIGVLGDIDNLIENNRRRVAVLEEMARKIYREWFIRYRFPGHKSATFADSPLGPIPNGWRAATVASICTVAKDTLDPASTAPETPLVGLEHIPRRQITLDSWGLAGDAGSRKARFARGDILFGRIRPYFHKASLAPFNGVCSTDVIVIRPTTEHWGLAVSVVTSDEFVALATQTSNGTKMPRAQWEVISQFPVAIPTSKLSHNFTEAVRPLYNLASALMFESRALAASRDLLLPRLVTGQIDVSTLGLGAEASSAAGD